MHRIALLALTLGGCGLIQKAKDTVSGLTNPLVAQGVILGIEPPTSNLIDLSGTDYAAGTGATVFLADAKDANDMENAPISGADVSVDAVVAAEASDGLYAIDPTAGLSYANNATWRVDIQIGDSSSSADIDLPPPANLSLSATHTMNTPLTVDLSGQGFNYGLIVVFDVVNGVPTWSNEPETIKEAYEMTRSSSEAGVIEIPAEAFPGRAIYAVGVAGMVNTGSGDLEGMNTVLSKFSAGKMVFSPVSTVQ